MTQQEQAQVAPDFDGALKIANVVHLLGAVVVVGGLIAAVVAIATGLGPVAAVLLILGGFVSGFALMALGVIAKMVTHTARNTVKP